MLRFWGFVVAWGLVFAGIGQAIANGFAPNGLTIIICGVGVLVGIVAWVFDIANDEDSARLSEVDAELDRRGL